MSMNKEQAIATAKQEVANQIAKYRAKNVISPPPTGLSIARANNKFTLTWKSHGEDYADGIQVQYAIKTKKWGGWESITVGNKATSASFTLDASKYYPNTTKKITGVRFRVRGNTKTHSASFTVSKKYEETVKKKKVTKTYKYTEKVTADAAWSPWADKEMDISPPSAPSISETVSENLSNVTVFAWSAESSASNKKPFTNVEWQTALVKNSNASKGSGYGASHTGSASGSTTQTETPSILADGNSYKRWVRVRSRGIGGASDWKEVAHVYVNAPNSATNVRGSAVKSGGTFTCTATWKTSASSARPIDRINVQYAITVPESGLVCPSGISWSDGIDLAYKNGNDRAKFSVDDTMTEDECLFIRVNTEFNAIYQSNFGKTFGSAILVAAGKLKPPSGVTVTTEEATFKATIKATNNSAVPDTFLAVVYRGSRDPNKQFVVGVIPSGSDTTIVQCPDWSDEGSFSFGVYAVAGTYTKQTRSDGADSYAIKAYSGKPLMKSDTVWEGGEVPLAPSNVTVEPTSVSGSVRVNWDWSWKNATGAEIAWSDHRDAWESTDEPDSYLVSNLYQPQWNIAGLALGTEWYIRVRFVREVADTTVYSPWSELTSASTINLSSPPETPSLNLSSPFVIEGGEITASWAYVSNDGTPQSFAEIREATITDEGITYGRQLITTGTEQSVVINASDVGWETGQTYNLVVKVTSGSGKESEQWSAPVSITVVEKLECAISSTSLVNGLLTEMPLTVTVSHEDGVTHTLAIEREESYYLERPDESVFAGHDGETVALITGNTTGQFTVDLESLIGLIDDGAKYRIVATSSDIYGQSATDDSVTFTVQWAHQALMPESSAYVYDDDYVAIIKVGKPEGALDTDVCDIYRLSADKPVLIMENVELGKWYIDPYPAIGRYGGHRVVYKTANGDYITAENQTAWVDLHGDDYLDAETAIIDWSGDRIELEYNLDLSHSWSKDFKETKYLGGSVQGDWNPAISRTGTVASVALSILDVDTIEKMRRLANHAGICHVRTPDGSSYFADVQVSEDSSYDTGHNVISYSLSITKVDPEELEGMTYGEYWHETKTASGQIASFNDAAENEPLKNLKFHISPIQDLHGYDHPWPEGGGVNQNNPNAPVETFDLTGEGVYRYGHSFAGGISYVIVNQNTQNLYFRIVKADMSDRGTTQTLGSNTHRTVNVASDEILWVFGTTPSDWLSIASNVAVNVGSVTTYAPYSNICPISGWTEIEGVATGFNVWDEEWESGTINVSTGATENNSNRIRSKNFISVKPNTIYCYKQGDDRSVVTGRACFYDIDKKFINGSSSFPSGGSAFYNPVEFTIPANAYYMKFSPSTNYGTTYNHDICINVSDPSKNGTYEPSHITKIPITLPSEAGTVYGGTLDVVSGELTVDRVCHTYEGGTDDVITSYSYDSNNTCFSIRSGVYPHVVTGNGAESISVIKPMCDKLPSIMFDSMRSATQGFASQGNWAPAFAIKVSGLTTAEEYNSWCAENKPQVSWLFATPQTYQLDPTEVKSLLGENHIWCDSGETEVEYLTNIEMYEPEEEEEG
jgi:hypothetical protein